VKFDEIPIGPPLGISSNCNEIHTYNKGVPLAKCTEIKRNSMKSEEVPLRISLNFDVIHTFGKGVH